MKFRTLDFLLLLVIVAGSFFAWRTGWERYQLTKRFERLSRKTGDLQVPDRTRAYVQALPTGESLHFAWRVHLPANFILKYRVASGWRGSSNSSTDSEFIARVRIREEEGRLKVFTRFLNSSGSSTLGDEVFAKLLHDRFETIQVTQLGSPEPVSIGPTQSIDLLELSFPREMREEARSLLADGSHGASFPVFFKVALGAEKPQTGSGSRPSPGE